MDLLLRDLTNKIKDELSGLFVEKFLYNFVRDFLYSSMKLSYNIPSPILLELPIIGVNYIIIYDTTKIKQGRFNKNLLFVEKKGKYIIEIMGYFTSFDYIKYESLSYSRNYTFHEIGENYLEKIIDCGSNPKLKVINVSVCKNLELPNEISDIETFIWNKYTFNYGENTTKLN